MAQSIGGKPWMNIVNTYYGGGNKAVTSKVTYGGRAGIAAGGTCFQVGRACLAGTGM